MAERRMFSRTILDSDKFLDMPLTSQALYVHLIINADDDGFLNNSQKITRIIGAVKKDFELLISSEFIINFDNGICVVKHWKLHNYIRSDRYKPTVYQNELSQLIVASNKVYEESKMHEKTKVYEVNAHEMLTYNNNNDGIPSVYHMETQNRLDEVSIDKDSIEEEIIDKIEETIDKTEDDNNDYVEKVIEKWNLLGISNISCIKNTRQKFLNARIKEYGTDNVINAIGNIEKSSFLKGQNDRGWVITFDWFVKPNNFIKVFEGNYDDNNCSSGLDLINSSKKLSFNNFPQREYDYDELEKKLLGWN